PDFICLLSVRSDTRSLDSRQNSCYHGADSKEPFCRRMRRRAMALGRAIEAQPGVSTRSNRVRRSHATEETLAQRPREQQAAALLRSSGGTTVRARHGGELLT